MEHHTSDIASPDASDTGTGTGSDDARYDGPGEPSSGSDAGDARF